jgi:hypothetical protein
MTRKQLFLLVFITTYSALLKGQDTLNFKKINVAMEPAFIIAGQDSLHYKKISQIKLAEVCDYPPYNAQRKAAYKNLSDEIDFLDFYANQLGDKNANYMAEAKLSNLKNSIDNFKRLYPYFNISGYETIYNYFIKKQTEKNEQEKIVADEQEKKREENQRISDSIKKQKDIIYKQTLQGQKIKDSINENAMLTVDENGQEYEIGYHKEYVEQMSFMSQSPHLCRFIGFKYYWVTQIPKYLMEEKTFNLESAELNSQGNLIIKMTPSFRTEAFYGNFQIKAHVDNDDRVTSLTITGDPVSLIHIFLWYWTSTPSLNKNSKLKTGLSYQKMIYDEDIIFTYSSSPSIIVKKRK